MAVISICVMIATWKLMNSWNITHTNTLLESHLFILQCPQCWMEGPRRRGQEVDEIFMWQFFMCFNVREGPREDQGGTQKKASTRGDPGGALGTPSLALPWIPLVLLGSLPDIETNHKLPCEHRGGQPEALKGLIRT